MFYLFFIFSFLCCGFAYLAMTQKNSIHAICSLIFVFLCAFFLMLFVEADFLAFTYIIVYVGAISVFFLFAVMLLDLKADEEKKQMTGYSPLHIILAFLNWFICNNLIMNLLTLKEYPHQIKGRERWLDVILTLNLTKDQYINWELVKLFAKVRRTTIFHPFCHLRSPRLAFAQDYTMEPTLSDVVNHGISLYYEYGDATIAMGALLFLSMFGVICLTFEYAKAFTKKQLVSSQHNTVNTIVLIS